MRALSVETGILDVAGTTEGELVQLIWTERGGPLVEHPKEASGYGSKLVNRSVAGQLGGTISHQWSEKGLVVVLNLKADKLAL